MKISIKIHVFVNCNSLMDWKNGIRMLNANKVRARREKKKLYNKDEGKREGKDLVVGLKAWIKREWLDPLTSKGERVETSRRRGGRRRRGRGRRS